MMVEIEAVARLGEGGAHPARECLRVPGGTPLPETLSHAVRCGDHLWVGATEATEPAEGVERLLGILSAAGGELANVAKLNAWFPGGGADTDWRSLVESLGAGFDAGAPVLSALPTPALEPSIGVRLWGWAVGRATTRRHARPPSGWRWPANLPFPSALACGDLVFLGGHPPLDERGALKHRGDLNEQTRLAMAHTRADLAAFGLDLGDMVKQTSFYLGAARAEDIVTNQRLRSSFYREPAGASTGVPLPGFGLSGAEIEIETIAMRR